MRREHRARGAMAEDGIQFRACRVDSRVGQRVVSVGGCVPAGSGEVAVVVWVGCGGGRADVCADRGADGRLVDGVLFPVGERLASGWEECVVALLDIGVDSRGVVDAHGQRLDTCVGLRMGIVVGVDGR